MAVGTRPGIASAPQDLDRLGPQRLVDRPVVLVGQLAGPQVELGVADLAVLGVARRLELGDPRGLGAGRPRAAALGARTAPRSRSTAPASTTRTITYAIVTTELALARGAGGARRRTRRPRAATAGARRRRGGGSGHSAISPPRAAMIAPEPQPRDQRRDDQQERRRPRVGDEPLGRAPRIAQVAQLVELVQSAAACWAGGSLQRVGQRLAEAPRRRWLISRCSGVDVRVDDRPDVLRNSPASRPTRLSLEPLKKRPIGPGSGPATGTGRRWCAAWSRAGRRWSPSRTAPKRDLLGARRWRSART